MLDFSGRIPGSLLPGRNTASRRHIERNSRLRRLQPAVPFVTRCRAYSRGAISHLHNSSRFRGGIDRFHHLNGAKSVHSRNPRTRYRPESRRPSRSDRPGPKRRRILLPPRRRLSTSSAGHPGNQGGRSPRKTSSAVPPQAGLQETVPRVPRRPMKRSLPAG